MQCTRKQRHVSRGAPWANLRSSRRDCPHVVRHTRLREARPPVTNCLTSKIRSSLHCRKFGRYKANWSQPSRMPAAVPSIFAIDSNPRLRREMRRASLLVRTKLEEQWLESRLSKMIQDLANSLVPIFVGLLLGMRQALFKIVDNKDVKSLVSFLMTFALPCSLFVTIARARLVNCCGSKPGRP